MVREDVQIAVYNKYLFSSHVCYTAASGNTHLPLFLCALSYIITKSYTLHVLDLNVSLFIFLLMYFHKVVVTYRNAKLPKLNTGTFWLKCKNKTCLIFNLKVKHQLFFKNLALCMVCGTTYFRKVSKNKIYFCVIILELI